MRLHDWWGSKIPPVLGAAYLALVHETAPMEPVRTLVRIALFLLLCFGVGGFGYLLTDAFDVEEDRRAGKANGWARLGVWQRAGLATAVVGAVVFPLGGLASGDAVRILLVLELLLLLGYAVPPIRLKERGFAGIVADASYAHVVPVLVAWATFTSPRGTWHDMVVPATLTAWMLPMGLRHLARHQHDDVDRDRLAGARTWGVRVGRNAAMRFIVERLMVAELLGALAALAAVATTAPLVVAGFVAHATWELHVVRHRWLAPLPSWARMSLVERHDLYGQRILSGFIERWFAPLALASLVLHDRDALWLAPLHLAVLGAPVRAWFRGLRSLPRPLRR